MLLQGRIRFEATVRNFDTQGLSSDLQKSGIANRTAKNGRPIAITPENLLNRFDVLRVRSIDFRQCLRAPITSQRIRK